MPVSMKPQPPADPQMEELGQILWKCKRGPKVGCKQSPRFQRSDLKARAAKMRRKYMFGGTA